ncbi:MAG: L-rhamnose mutarotase [Bacteroidota bacterium]
MPRTYYFACDLKDDPALMEAYRQHHAPGQVWPEITQSIREAGILDMQIFQTGHRLLMVMEVSDEFDFDKKSVADAANPKVQEWESLMDSFQQYLPWAKPGEKWVRLERIFSLAEQR